MDKCLPLKPVAFTVMSCMSTQRHIQVPLGGRGSAYVWKVANVLARISNTETGLTGCMKANYIGRACFLESLDIGTVLPFVSFY